MTHAFCYLESEVADIFGQQCAGIGQVVSVNEALLQSGACLWTAHIHQVRQVPLCLKEHFIGGGSWVGDYGEEEGEGEMEGEGETEGEGEMEGEGETEGEGRGEGRRIGEGVGEESGRREGRIEEREGRGKRRARGECI